MKRTLILLMILGLSLGLAAPAPAAAPKVPTSLCFHWGDLDDTTSLVIKKGSSVTMTSGKVSYYNLSGKHLIPRDTPITVPLIGTGYVQGNVFHFSFTGAAAFDAGSGLQTHSLSVDGSWDLVAYTGSINYHWSLPTDGIEAINAMDCKTSLPLQQAGVNP
jgi:hypothetical protein